MRARRHAVEDYFQVLLRGRGLVEELRGGARDRRVIERDHAERVPGRHDKQVPGLQLRGREVQAGVCKLLHFFRRVLPLSGVRHVRDDPGGGVRRQVRLELLQRLGGRYQDASLARALQEDLARKVRGPTAEKMEAVEHVEALLAGVLLHLS